MNKMAIAALGLGAAFLMRNKKVRGRLMRQFESLAEPFTSKNGSSNS
ncbi:hypothetical protein [Sporosarcina koreensis]|uniref:PEP-CTERM protein-sorting domain-containing protein n=1 Tax=Sporosarcina koreensis TaxID=334735 RepID=A0ABW0U0N8_9BACL